MLLTLKYYQILLKLAPLNIIVSTKQLKLIRNLQPILLYPFPI